MNQNGAFVAPKANIKRRAFGDVSNTIKNTVFGTNNNDNGALEKLVHQVLEKPIQAQQDKKSALLRPAQRPLSVSNVKSLLNNSDPSSEAQIDRLLPVAEHAVSSKTFNKRSTAVFKDPNPAVAETLAILRKEAQIDASNAPVHQNLQPRHHKSQPVLRSDQAKLRRAKSTFAPLFNEEESDTQHDYPAHSDELHSDKGYPEEVPSPVYEDAEEHHGVYLTKADLEQVELHSTLDGKSDVKLLKTKESRVSEVAVISEGEEAWEEDEEYYDEDGYTTAHSLRSRRDNTTGGATTVLGVPKVTAKVKREIAIAKELTESSRKKEDIEDEAWDVTMVAEYGDEIFDYLRELEVRQHPAIYSHLYIKQ